MYSYVIFMYIFIDLSKTYIRFVIEYFDYISRKLLSPQQHYDWGLRALKTIVSGCGSALKASKQSGKQESEMSLVVQVLRLNTLSKLTFSDSTQFDLLIQDIFTDITFLSSGYETFVKNIRESYEDLELVYSARQVLRFYLGGFFIGFYFAVKYWLIS